MIDSHIHLDDQRFNNDRCQLLDQAREAGINGFVLPATMVSGFAKIKQLADEHTDVYPAYGLHPYFIEQHQHQDLQKLADFLADNDAIALGECGLDFYRDDLDRDKQQVIFEQHEERNHHLHAMFLGWQPSSNFFELLPRQGISEEFARELIDEFVLYWVNKDRRETSWDQKFLGWVKREWVKKQTRDGREQRQAQQQTGFNHENSRRDTRENRKRVTQAIMDIKDTDW